MKPVEFLFSAEREVDQTITFYLSKSDTLADKFLNEVANTVNLISKSPEAFGLVAENIRMKLVSKFSYAIYYQVFPNKILVLSVAHTSRKPKNWEDFS